MDWEQSKQSRASTPARPVDLKSFIVIFRERQFALTIFQQRDKLTATRIRRDHATRSDELFANLANEMGHSVGSVRINPQVVDVNPQICLADRGIPNERN